MKKTITVAGLALLVVICILPSTVLAQGQGQQWVGTWTGGAEPGAPLDCGFASEFPDGFTNQTIRNIVHTSIGGSGVRGRLTNAFGGQPVTFDAAYIGIAHSGAALAPGSNRALLFGGSTSVTIAPGAEIWSDPLAFNAPSEGNLAVSLYAESPTGTPTLHLFARATTYVANGDLVASGDGTAFAPASTSWIFIDRVDVLTSPRVKGPVVALGGSVTDGDGSTLARLPRSAISVWTGAAFKYLSICPFAEPELQAGPLMCSRTTHRTR